MANWGDSRVREWMHLHPDVAEGIQARRDELQGLSLARLVKLAHLDGADVTRVREILIARIIKVERSAATSIAVEGSDVKEV